MSCTECPNDALNQRVVPLDAYPNVFEKQVGQSVAARLTALLMNPNELIFSRKADHDTGAIPHGSCAYRGRKGFAARENSPPGWVPPS
jgi:hypothetical protein